MSMDFSELQVLSAGLGRASSGLVREAHAVIAKGALNIKEDTRKTVSDHPTWKRIAQSVNYEQVGLSADVGYDDVGQGELAGIYEFGSARRAPHPTLYPAAERELPRFEQAMLDAAARLVEDAL